jgi:hypothetical protein
LSCFHLLPNFRAEILLLGETPGDDEVVNFIYTKTTGMKRTLVYFFTILLFVFYKSSQGSIPVSHKSLRVNDPQKTTTIGNTQVAGELPRL